MKLVVGLGNPGPKYAATRHNIGFRVGEALARAWGATQVEPRFGGRFATGTLGGEPAAVLLPETYMNSSGDAVAAALAGLSDVDTAGDLLVVYDDLDLPFGRLRVRPRGGAGGHRGMEDIIACLGTRDFPRLRVGIGRGPRRDAVIDHVLSPFDADEEAALAAGLLGEACRAAEAVLVEGATAAMDRFNRAPTATGPDPENAAD